MTSSPSSSVFLLTKETTCAQALAFKARQVANTSSPDPSLALSPSDQALVDQLASCYSNGICVHHEGEAPFCSCHRGWTIDSHCAKLASEDYPANRAVLAARLLIPSS